LLGWSPKDDREQMTRDELVQAFSFEGVNRSNAVVNFTEEDPSIRRLCGSMPNTSAL